MKNKKTIILIVILLCITVVFFICLVRVNISNEEKIAEMDSVAKTNYDEYLENINKQEYENTSDNIVSMKPTEHIENKNEIIIDTSEVSTENTNEAQEKVKINEQTAPEGYHWENGDLYDDNGNLYEDPENSGDITITYGSENKFVNWELFVNEVDVETIELFNNSITNELLSLYPDLTYISYNKDTKTIYAESLESDYNFEFLYDEGENSYYMRMTIK